MAENQTFDTRRRSLCFTEKKNQAQTAVVNKTFEGKKNAPMRIYLQNFTEKHKVAFWTKLDWFNAKIVSLQSINLQKLGPQQ